MKKDDEDIDLLPDASSATAELLYIFGVQIFICVLAFAAVHLTDVRDLLRGVYAR